MDKLVNYLIAGGKRPPADRADEAEQVVDVVPRPHHHLVRPQALTTSTALDAVSTETEI